MDEMLRPVVTEITCATAMIPRAMYRPALPTTQGRRMYMMTPRIVRIDGVNTPPKVPNFPSFDMLPAPGRGSPVAPRSIMLQQGSLVIRPAADSTRGARSG